MNEPDITQPEGEAAAPTREQILSELAESTNQEFEAAVASSSNRAFNLGCSLTLLPGIILVLLVFILSRANWAMTLVTAVLVTMVAAIFTIFVAQQTKTRSTESASTGRRSNRSSPAAWRRKATPGRNSPIRRARPCSRVHFCSLSWRTITLPTCLKEKI